MNTKPLTFTTEMPETTPEIQALSVCIDVLQTLCESPRERRRIVRYLHDLFDDGLRMKEPTR